MSSFVALLSLCASLAYANAIPEVADPTITPAALLRRQDDQRFMGWLSLDGTYTSRQCQTGNYWYQSGDYAGCCRTSKASCNFATGCVDGTMLYTYTTGTISVLSRPCTDIWPDPTDASFTVCNTGFIFENLDDSSPQTNIFCGVSSINWSYYRVIPTTTIIAETSSTYGSSIALTIPTATTTTSPSPTPNPTPAPSSKSKSKAWIAGAVVGPVGAIAIAGLIFWIFVLKRRQHQNTPPTQPVAQHPYTGPPGHDPAQAGGFNPYGPPIASSTTPGSPAPGYASGPQSPPQAMSGVWGTEQKPGIPDPRPFSTEMYAGSPPPVMQTYYPPPTQSPPPQGAH